MAATTYTQTTSLYSATGIQGSTRIIAAWGRTRNKNLPPVIDCGGWPDANPWGYSIFSTNRKALLSVGYTLVSPWCGANWGRPSGTSAPSSGPSGTGTNAISDARIWANSVLGLPNNIVHLYGVSMGGTNVLAWANANQSLVGGVYALSPGISLMHIWDISGTPAPGGGNYPNYASSMAAAYGTPAGNRSAFETASQNYDPIRNATSFSNISSQISIYAARDDDVIGWDNCVQFAESSGATLKASAPEGENGGGHITPTWTDAYDEFDALRLFNINNP